MDKQDFEWASGFYLSQDLPEGWEDMEEDKLFSTFERSAWHPFENWGGASIYDEIETLARSVRIYINKEKLEQ
jgi:hypothetical protein